MKSSAITEKMRAAWTKGTDPQQLRQHEDKVLYILTLMIGAAVGLVIVAFILLTENLGTHMYPAGGAAWRRFLIPIAGSLITGYLLLRHFPDARGSGIPQTKVALFLHSGIISLRTVLGKFWCSSVSLASGIALGREGPSVQVGAGIASVLGRQLGLSPNNAKALVPIGSSAALAAAFNTPIAAVLFTLEEVMGDLHARVLGAVVMSSATSWMVLHLLLGDEPLFHVPAYQLVHPVEFVFYAALGVAGGIVSSIFVKLLLKLRSYFQKMPPWSLWLQPAAGGLLVGALALFVPAVLGVGYNHVSDALNSRLTLETMALLVALKLVATASCYASGNAGGIFGPSLFIGAMMGGAFGAGAHFILPDYTGSVGAYALVGMGAAFAGIIRVPMTSVIMIFEITRDYSIIVPLMIANLLSYFISSRLQKKPIYEALMDQDGIRLPPAPRDLGPLKSVGQGLRAPDKVFQRSDKIRDALKDIQPGIAAWPVVDNNRLIGMVTLEQIQEAEQSGRHEGVIADLLSSLEANAPPNPESPPFLYPDQPLDTAFRRMAQCRLNALPVVDRVNPGELVGVISMNDALSACKPDSGAEVPDPDQKTKGAPTKAIGGIAAVLVLMVAMATFLSYFYRSQRADRAEQFAASGNDLMKGGRYQEAIEKYRSALSISHSSEDRLSLANALVKAGRWPEAEDRFKELARETPDSGPVNLGLGRIAVQKQNVKDAVHFYHKSIYGNWPQENQADRTQMRMELIDFLGRSDRMTQTRVELLALMAESPDDVAVREQVARLLLRYGLIPESVQLFQEIVKQSPQNAASYAGLGQAQFASGNFRAAQQSFKISLRRNPADLQSKQRLETIEEVLALHPNLRGLKARDRHERSRKLVAALLQSLDQCLVNAAMPLSVAEADITNEARKSIASSRRPRSYSDATEANLVLSEQLWKVRVDACGQPKATDEVLTTLMAQIIK